MSDHSSTRSHSASKPHPKTQRFFAQSYPARRNDKLDPFLKRPEGQPASKLSQGPRDPLHRHRTYRKNDRSIWNVIDRMIAERTMGMRVWHVCFLALISSPTFYLHFRSLDDARKKYELHVQEDFHQGISRTLSRETAFGLFLVYMKKNQSYFKAAFKGEDTLVLHQLFHYYRPIFGHGNIDDRAYIVYVNSLIGILFCWYKYDHMSTESQDFYVRKLVRQRIMHF